MKAKTKAAICSMIVIIMLGCAIVEPFIFNTIYIVSFVMTLFSIGLGALFCFALYNIFLTFFE